MAIELSKQETDASVHSLRKYFSEELGQELSGLGAKVFLDYVLKEIAPFAYNQGVKHAENYFRAKVEDLPASVFEPEMTYWKKK